MAYKLIKCGDYRERRTFSKIKRTYELKDEEYEYKPDDSNNNKLIE